MVSDSIIYLEVLVGVGRSSTHILYIVYGPYPHKQDKTPVSLSLSTLYYVSIAVFPKVR